VDVGSSVGIITFKCPDKLQYVEKDLEAIEASLVGFRGLSTYPSGTKKLLVQMGDKDNSRNSKINFLIIDIPMAYNVILGCPTLKAIKAVVTPYFLLI